MSFLFPLYLLGAAAIAIPILLHLRRRPPKEHVPFSSLMFLEKSPERLTRRTRIERWLLLALRCLALILLALVFGRPFFRSAELDLETGEGSRLVVLIDRSASMQREDLWKRAVAEAEEIVGKTGIKDEVAVVLFDDTFEVISPFEVTKSLSGRARADAMKQAIGEKPPGWKGSRLGAALTSAAELIEDTNAESAREFEFTEVAVISDFQEGAERESLNRYAWPEDIRVRTIAVSPKDAGNFALHLVAATADEGADDNRPDRDSDLRRSRRVRISNARESEVENFTLAWKEGGEKLAGSFLPAGASRVMAAPPRPDESSDGVLMISGDRHDFDNQVYVARAQPQAVRILFLAEEAGNADVGSPLFYLSRAMHKTPSIDPSVVSQSFAEFESDGKELAASNVVVVHGAAPEKTAEAVGKFAEDGGLVVAVVSEESPAESLAPILGIDGLTLAEAEVRDFAMLADLDFDHPVLAPFARAKVRDFTKVRTWKHRSLTLPESAEERVRVLAEFDSGDPAWIEVLRGEGSVFAFLSGWEPRESQLALSSKFVPLVYAILGQGGFSATESKPVYVGDPLPISGPATVTLPDGSSVGVEDGVTTFFRTDQPGFYTAKVEGAEDRIFAVNLTPSESRIDPVDPVAALGDLGVAVETDAAASAEALANLDPAEAEKQKKRLEAEEKEDRQKLWKWLVLAVLLILILETWLAGRRKGAAAVEGAQAA